MAAWNLNIPVMDFHSENQRAASEAIRSIGDSFSDAYVRRQARRDKADEIRGLREEKSADRLAALEDAKSLDTFRRENESRVRREDEEAEGRRLWNEISHKPYRQGAVPQSDFGLQKPELSMGVPPLTGSYFQSSDVPQVMEKLVDTPYSQDMSTESLRDILKRQRDRESQEEKAVVAARVAEQGHQYRLAEEGERRAGRIAARDRAAEIARDVVAARLAATPNKDDKTRLVYVTAGKQLSSWVQAQTASFRAPSQKDISDAFEYFLMLEKSRFSSPVSGEAVSEDEEDEARGILDGLGGGSPR